MKETSKTYINSLEEHNRKITSKENWFSHKTSSRILRPEL